MKRMIITLLIFLCLLSAAIAAKAQNSTGGSNSLQNHPGCLAEFYYIWVMLVPGIWVPLKVQIRACRNLE